MSLINYEDYINFPALNAAIKELAENNKQFGILTENVFKGIKINIDAVTQSMRNNLTVTQNFNVNQKNAIQGIQNLNKSNTDLINKLNQYQQVEKNLSTLSEQLSKNNIILNGTVEKITAEYNALSDTEEKDIARKQELITISNVLANAITNYNNATINTTGLFKQLQQAQKDSLAYAEKIKAEYGEDSEQYLKAAAAAEKYSQQLANINAQLKAKPIVQEQPVPFTTNINEVNTESKNVSNATGTVVNTEEVAATQQQLIVQRELDAEKQNSVVITKEQIDILTQSGATEEEINQILQTKFATQSELNDVVETYVSLLDVDVASQTKDEAITQLITEAKDKLAFALSEVNVQLKGYALQTEQANAAAKLEAEETLGLSGAYKRLTIDLAAAKIEAKNLAAQYGVDSVQARQAATSASLLDTQVKAIDKSVGESQRNVGNYSSAFTKGFSSIFSYVRQIAYILPGIGIAGIFSAAFTAITDLISSLKLFDDATDDAKRHQTELNTAVASSSSEFVQASNNVLKLQADVQLAKDGFISKSQVVKEYNDTLGDAIGKVSDLDGVEQALVKHGDDYIHAIFLRAIANQALEESSKKAFEAEQKRLEAPAESLTGYEKFTNKVNDIDNSIQNVLRDVSSGIVDIQNLPTPFTGIVEQVQGVNDSLKDSKSAFDIFQDYLKQSEEFAKTHGINLESFLGKDKAKGAVDSTFEILKEALTHQIANLQEFVNNGTILFKERFQAAKDEADLEKQLSDLVLNEDIKNGKNRILAEQQNAFRIEDINKQLVANLQKINQDRNKNPFPDLPIAAPVDNTEAELAAHQKFIDNLIKQTQEGGKAILTTSRLNEQYELQANQELYDAGLIKRERYESAKIDIADKYKKIALEIELATQQAILAFLPANSNAAEEAKEKIKEIENAIGELNLKITDLDKTARALAIDKIFEQFNQSAQALANIVGSDIADGFQSLTNLIEKLTIDGKASLADYAATASAVANGIVAEANAADEQRISNLEKNKNRELQLAKNNAAAQQAINDRYDKEEAKIKRKEAVNNKISALFQIALNTAVGVANAASKVVTLPLIPIIVGLGAAEAALVLAQPLPQFEKGTMNAVEGFAVVDEKGSELIVDKDGNLREVGADYGPRITYLNQGDRVYSATKTKEILRSYKKESVLKEIETSELIKNVLHSEQQNNIVREINLQSMLTKNIQQGKHAEAVSVMHEALANKSSMNESMVVRLEKAIEKIPVHQTIIDEEGVKERLKRADGLTTYRNTLKLGYKK